MQYNIIQYNAIENNTIQYNTIPIQYNTIQKIQYNTIQYHTMQYNIIQCNTIHYNNNSINAKQWNSTWMSLTKFIDRGLHLLVQDHLVLVATAICFQPLPIYIWLQCDALSHHGRDPRRRYISTYPTDCKSSRRDCSLDVNYRIHI